MLSARWITVEAKIVECAPTSELETGHPWFEIVADVTIPAGTIERVSSRQKLDTLTHQWRAPKPGEIVPARFNPARGKLRLELGGDPRYDERRRKAIERKQSSSSAPIGIGHNERHRS